MPQSDLPQAGVPTSYGTYAAPPKPTQLRPPPSIVAPRNEVDLEADSVCEPPIPEVEPAPVRLTLNDKMAVHQRAKGIIDELYR